MQQPKEPQRFTYADYLAWDGDTRYELIDGEPYMMAPAPSPNHQRISGALFAQLHNYLRGKPCEVFSAPFDVRLNADAEDNTVVQPDISVICDPSKIDERGCKGAPDMIIEILSPSTAIYDQNTKLSKYLESGVREYWLVNPDERAVQVYLFEGGKGTFHLHKEDAVVPVGVLDGCLIHLGEVFPKKVEAGTEEEDAGALPQTPPKG